MSTMYDKCVKFRDPVTSINSLQGFTDYVEILRLLFETTMQVHYAKQTGPSEFTARWTVVMELILLPWKPELVITGVSIMGLNPKTQKFCSHVDRWDSAAKSDYFYPEDLWDVVRKDPNQEPHGLREVGGIAVISKFSGNPTEGDVCAKEKALRSAVLRDGLKPKEGCILICYNDPERTWSFRMRNEVLIWLEDFRLE